MFEPPVAMASLSGASDAEWARAGAPYVGAAFLGGIAICSETCEAARRMVSRDRDEFLPPDPVTFVEDQLAELEGVPLQTGVNVRAVATDRIAAVAAVCRDYDAIYEVNAHCRQEEMCAAGAGETLLADTERLVEQVRTASDAGATVSVKVRAEVPGVDLAETANAVAEAGASAIHVDAMDSEPVIGDVVDAADLFVIANNGVRGRKSVADYFDYGADAVSVGRPSDRPDALERISAAVAAYRRERGSTAVPTSNDR